VTHLGTPIHLRVVPEETPGPLAHDEANAEFQQHWQAARKAYSELLTHAGSLAVPLLIADGPIRRGRIRATQHPAERIAEHARAITEHLAICDDIWVRANNTARTTHPHHEGAVMSTDYAPPNRPQIVAAINAHQFIANDAACTCGWNASDYGDVAFPEFVEHHADAIAYSAGRARVEWGVQAEGLNDGHDADVERQDDEDEARERLAEMLDPAASEHGVGYPDAHLVTRSVGAWTATEATR
jgi:hypothetical protein